MNFCCQHYHDSFGNGQSKSLRIVLDEFLGLGHDSIDNYEEREVSKEEFDSFFESVGVEKKIK